MTYRNTLLATLLAASLAGAHAADAPAEPVKPEPYAAGKTLTRNIQAGITPDGAIAILKEGNARFATGKPLQRDYKAQVSQTALGQYPFASFVACIDSRSTPEQVFDLGVGDAFSMRVAGNTVNEDILGSLEYASKLAGSRLIVVLGHTNCGAIKGACDDVKMGNLTALLDKFKPAVSATKTEGERSAKNSKFVRDVTDLNVKQTVEAIRARSPILKEMEDQGKIRIVGALYDTSSGKVLWY
jgi:carbonic anhydrase